MLVVGVEVEDALNEVLAEHFWALLQQQVQQTVFTQANTRNSRCDVKPHTLTCLLNPMAGGLPGNGRNRVYQDHHKPKEEGALPFNKFFLQKKIKNNTNWCRQ